MEKETMDHMTDRGDLKMYFSARPRNLVGTRRPKGHPGGELIDLMVAIWRSRHRMYGYWVWCSSWPSQRLVL